MRLDIVAAAALLSLCGAVANLGAQSTSHVVDTRVDTVTVTHNFFLRAHGDTLWFTPFAENLPGQPRDSTQVILVRGDSAAMVIGSRAFKLPPNLARIYRNFHTEALACPKPAVGCAADEELMRKLGNP